MLQLNLKQEDVEEVMWSLDQTKSKRVKDILQCQIDSMRSAGEWN